MWNDSVGTCLEGVQLKINIDDRELAGDSNWSRSEAKEHILSVLNRYAGEIYWLKIKMRKREGKSDNTAYLCTLRIRTRFSLEVIESSAISVESSKAALECVRRSQRTIARRLAFRGVGAPSSSTVNRSSVSN